MSLLINLPELVVSIFVIYSGVVNCQISPCPHIFEYKYDEYNKSYGIATLPTKFGQNNIQVKFGLDQELDQLKPARITHLQGTQELIEQIQNKSNIEYKIVFPSEISSIPVLLSIILDDQEYCENTNGTTFKTTLILKFQLNITGPYMGRTERPFIYGRYFAQNEFPWLVALFDHKGTFFCGGTLVTDQHVISAAHCTTGKESVRMELGKHELDNRNESGVEIRSSQRIVNHPEYKPNTGHADISIIILSEKVSFSKKIKPISLWSFDENHVGLIGTVAGWGIDISGEGTNTPMGDELAIVSDTECRNSHPVFANITSEATFCAGGQNKGPCSGDSGSGFVVKRNNQWYLKGITSTSLKAGNSNSCYVNKYAVYCDVGKYSNWFKNYL